MQKISIGCPTTSIDFIFLIAWLKISLSMRYFFQRLLDSSEFCLVSLMWQLDKKWIHSEVDSVDSWPLFEGHRVLQYQSLSPSRGKRKKVRDKRFLPFERETFGSKTYSRIAPSRFWAVIQVRPVTHLSGVVVLNPRAENYWNPPRSVVYQYDRNEILFGMVKTTCL